MSENPALCRSDTHEHQVSSRILSCGTQLSDVPGSNLTVPDRKELGRQQMERFGGADWAKVSLKGTKQVGDPTGIGFQQTYELTVPRGRNLTSMFAG
jgi:hypothetical protein